jgi:NitT/TauT family transport system ATP-binding protein
MLPLEIKKSSCHVFPRFLLAGRKKPPKSQENVEFANSLLQKYGLWKFKKSYPDELSGGMRQRAALIRTLALRPKILLLDEPFSALDYQTRLNVVGDVYKIIRREKKTAVLVTHDISEAISVADRIIVLTARPATVLRDYPVRFEGGLSPLERREHPDFRLLFEKLWRDLNDESNRAN